jgi:GTP pyrophosphokinase
MLLAMARDIRVIIIKLADRLHNMRTLDVLNPEKQRKIAQETWDIYAPLANRLGIGWMKAELEDLAFKHLEPEKYKALCEKVARWREERGTYVTGVKEVITNKLAEHGIKGEITGRLKHLYSIYRKMMARDVEFEEIHDVIAFRVIVDSISDCYAVLGLLHSTWKPVPGRFKDFIAIPRTNLYQSLHTTVVGPYGWRMELQIRTSEMHRVAEYGIAAHWKYKEGKTIDGEDDKRFAWLRQLLEWQRDLKDSDEFMETVKVDLFPEDVFVFTPKGDVKVFPKGATPVDFAYAIHTDVGHSCIGAKVNGRMVPLKHTLRNGNVVDILTSGAHRPSKDWLRFAVTSRAKNRIRQWIKTEEREKSIILGKEIIEKQFKKHGLDLTGLLKSGQLERIAREEFGLQGIEHLELNIGYGKVSIYQVLTRIIPPEKVRGGPQRKVSGLRRVLERLKSAPKPAPGKEGVIIKGVEDILLRFAKCCYPLPGDDIVGFISHGQGVSIHNAKCPNLLTVDPERQIEVEWDKETRTLRQVKIEVICINEKGLLADMSSAIKNADANISGVDIEVNDREHLKNTIRSLQKVKKVLKVTRVGGELMRSGEQPAL